MKKILLYLLLTAIVITYCVPFAYAVDEPAAPIVSGGSLTLDADKPMLGNEQLTKNAKSIILYERTSKTLMYEWNSDERTDPASLVKIMTGLIVVERGVLTDAVTVSAAALDGISIGAANAGLQADEVLTVEQLLYCMLVSSANDAAAVLAEYISGSQSAFVALMNEYAQELGCTDTNFTNAHGLYDENQYSTARDIARILDAAMENDAFRTIFCTKEYQIPATNKHDQRTLYTGNFLMSTRDVKSYLDERVVGGRTGITGAGTRSLATVAQAKNMELICILLGAESVFAEDGVSVQIYGGYEETSAILSKGFNGLYLTQVIRQDQVLTQKSVINGECDVVLGPVDSAFSILPDSITPEDLTYRFADEQPLEAPIEKGEIVASVEVWYSGICIAQTMLYAMNSVDVIQEQTITGTDENQGTGGSLLWIFLTIVLVLILGLFAVRVIRHISYRRKMARNRHIRRNRRRSR